MGIYIIKEEIRAYVSSHSSITKWSEDILTSTTIQYKKLHHKPKHFKSILIQYTVGKN